MDEPTTFVRKRVLYVAVGMLVVLGLGLAGLIVVSRRRPKIDIPTERLRPCPPDAANCVSSHSEAAHQRIDPYCFDDSPDAAFDRLKSILKNRPRTTVLAESADYLHLEVTTPLLRFADDVEFLLDRSAKVIHCRSSSRVGKSDLGVNRTRIESIRNSFNEAAHERTNIPH